MKKTGLEHVLEHRFKLGVVFRVVDPNDSDHLQIYMCRAADRTGVTLDNITFTEHHKPWFVYGADVPEISKCQVLFTAEPTYQYEIMLGHLRKYGKYLSEAAQLGVEIAFDLKHKHQNGIDHPPPPLQIYSLYFKDQISCHKVNYFISPDGKIFFTRTDNFQLASFGGLKEARDYIASNPWSIATRER